LIKSFWFYFFNLRLTSSDVLLSLAFIWGFASLVPAAFFDGFLIPDFVAAFAAFMLNLFSRALSLASHFSSVSSREMGRSLLLSRPRILARGVESRASCLCVSIQFFGSFPDGLAEL